MKKLLTRFFSFLGIFLIKPKTRKRLLAYELEYFKLLKLLEFKNKFENTIIDVEVVNEAREDVGLSKAQLHQDLVCLMLLGFKTNGFFVEFGATDGLKFSNTWLLERKYDWNGVLVEPAKNWHERLFVNRDAIIDTRCVSEFSGKRISFNETEIGELSTIDKYSFSDEHSNLRIKGTVYEVETVSLTDLLDQHAAPTQIDFLSIDTEGSEYEILLGLNFEKYTFSFIVCEHNYSTNRDLVYNLLTSRGYKRILSEISLFDDWYISQSLAQQLDRNRDFV